MGNPRPGKLSDDIIIIAAYATQSWNTAQDWRAASHALAEIIDDAGATLSDAQVETLKLVAAVALRPAVLIQRAARAPEQGA